MMDYIKNHKMMSLLLLVALIAAAWWGFTSSTSPSAVLSTTTTDASNPQDSQIVTTLLQLQAVTLSGTILSDPGFLSLQDFTTQVTSEPLGRPDPFAPVSPGQSLSTSTGTINPNLFAPAKH